jgi:hypothetical protein
LSLARHGDRFCEEAPRRPVIAKLAFIPALLEKKVDFIALDSPHATKFNLHILATVAEFDATRFRGAQGKPRLPPRRVA